MPMTDDSTNLDLARHGPSIKNDSAHRAAELAAIFARLTTLPPHVIATEIRHLQRLARQVAGVPSEKQAKLCGMALAVAQRLGSFMVLVEDDEMVVQVDGARLKIY